jgi:site-specific DNA recombinase
MTDNAIGRALSYLRVSTPRQLGTAVDIDADGLSIATQRDFAVRKAAALGTTVGREFLEPGHSAQTIEKRPVFREMLDYIVAHPGEIDYVIIYMRSRAFRNYVDAGVTERQLARLGIKLVSAKEDFGEGIWADAMKGVLDIMNEVQSRMSGEDIRNKMAHKARNGGTISRARLGYLNVRAEHDGRLVNTIALDPERAPLVRTAFELYAEGDVSFDRLAEAMEDLGLTTRATAKWSERPVGASKLHTTLTDPYYAGFVSYEDELVPGRHDAIVSQELFDRVQDVISARSQRGQRDRIIYHYLKGMLFCQRCHAAGRTSRLVYSESRGRNGTRYGYFKCLGRQAGVCDLPHLPVAQVEQAVERAYAQLELPTALTDAIQLALRETMHERQAATEQVHSQLRKQLRKLAIQEERLIDLAADGTLPQDKIRVRLNKILMERRAAEERLTQTDRKLAAGAELLSASLQLLHNIDVLYCGAPDTVRRSLNETFFQRFFIDEHGLVAQSVYQVPFDDIVSAAAAYRRRSERLQRSRQGCVNKKPARNVGGLDVESGPEFLDVLADGWSKTVMVGVTGFEPAASSSRTKRATKLRHTPQSNRPSITGARTPIARRVARPQRATSVNTVASGRQAKRIGVQGLVPTPALTCSHIRPSSHRCNPRARARSRPQLVTSAGPNGTRTCPPWVCPARTRS